MDKKAKKILFNTYWTAAGWINVESRKTDPIDFEYAKEKGLMFDNLTISKNELFSRLEKVTRVVSMKSVTDAFLCSLTNNKLEWRSAFGSYVNAFRLLTEPSIDETFWGYGNNKDLNVLNFGRIKWGGVRHSLGLYNLLDLELFSKETIHEPSREDAEMLQAIFNVLKRAKLNEKFEKVAENLKGTFKATKHERQVMIEILAVAGIISPLKYDFETAKYYFGRYGIE